MKDAYPLLKKSEVGMTVIEMLLTMSVLLVIASMLPTVFYVWKKDDSEKIIYEEVVLFFILLQKDGRKFNHIWTNDEKNILYFSNGNGSDVIQYEKYNDIIRRRVNGKGHEVFLQGVRDFHVEVNSLRVFIRLKGIDGTVYEKNIIYPTLLGER